jgi:uncharacterized protein (DUF1800 family)
MTHPITPPPELVQQWWAKAINKPDADALFATRAAQWGADQELDACCHEVQNMYSGGSRLRDARRPKPPSLKEQAKQALGRFNANAHRTADEMMSDFDLLRRALEQLDD